MIKGTLISNGDRAVTDALAVRTNPVTPWGCHNNSSMTTKDVRGHVTFIFNTLRGGRTVGGPTACSMGAATEETPA